MVKNRTQLQSRNPHGLAKPIIPCRRVSPAGRFGNSATSRSLTEPAIPFAAHPILPSHFEIIRAVTIQDNPLLPQKASTEQSSTLPDIPRLPMQALTITDTQNRNETSLSVTALPYTSTAGHILTCRNNPRLPNSSGHYTRNHDYPRLPLEAGTISSVTKRAKTALPQRTPIYLAMTSHSETAFPGHSAHDRALPSQALTIQDCRSETLHSKHDRAVPKPTYPFRDCQINP